MQWADYSGGRPSGAALKAAGFGGVIRYIGLGGEGKQLTAAEYRDLVASGVSVLLVAEANTSDAWGTETDDDYARGAANARIALADARAQGVPDSVGIACAADAHAAAYQIDDVVRYARGFESVIGKPRCGFYGFQETLTAVHDAGIGSWFWRCGSEPSAAEKTWVHFWQRNTAPTVRTVSGVQCDINEQYRPINTEDEMTPQEFLDTQVKWWDGHTAKVGDILAEVYVASRGLGGKPAFADQKAAVQLPPLNDIKAAVSAPAPVTIDLDALAAKVAALVPAIDYASLAKAVNDDNARRMAS